ncbi:hypothetical protein OAG12_01795 [Akkermansiaceae bacterium]|nr:hypothetical protein [Akkermansiaceae bacterium]
MARPKNSRSTVMLSRKQLEDLVGEGGLVCVPKKWLKHLGFDVDQQKYATGLGYHPDGKEIWSYKDWEAEKMGLEHLAKEIDQQIKLMRKDLAELKKEGRWVEEEPKMPTKKKRMVTENELRSYEDERAAFENSSKLFTMCHGIKTALDMLLAKKEENDKKLGKFHS